MKPHYYLFLLKCQQQPGFTLSDLLVSLMLLGMIAASTIPKILQATARTETQAKLKDAMGLLESTWYNLKFTNQYLPNASLYQNFKTGGFNKSFTLNAASDSDSTPSTTGCTNLTSPFALQLTGYFTLQNGTVIAGMDEGQPLPPNLGLGSSYGPNNLVLCIDVNGSGGPNTPGQDVFYANFNPSGDFDTWYDTAQPAYKPTENGKNFYWGDQSDTLFSYSGATIFSLPTVGKFIMSSNS